MHDFETKIFEQMNRIRVRFDEFEDQLLDELTEVEIALKEGRNDWALHKIEAMIHSIEESAGQEVSE